MRLESLPQPGADVAQLAVARGVPAKVLAGEELLSGALGDDQQRVTGARQASLDQCQQSVVAIELEGRLGNEAEVDHPGGERRGRREKAGVSEVMHVIGDVEDQECILIDDMVDSAGTICNAASALMHHGASSVRALATHGVFSGSAVERIQKSPMTEMVVTDSIAHGDDVNGCKKIKFLTIAPLIGEAILRISEERSVSSLFDNVPAGG